MTAFIERLAVARSLAESVEYPLQKNVLPIITIGIITRIRLFLTVLLGYYIGRPLKDNLTDVVNAPDVT